MEDYADVFNMVNRGHRNAKVNEFSNTMQHSKVPSARSTSSQPHTYKAKKSQIAKQKSKPSTRLKAMAIAGAALTGLLTISFIIKPKENKDIDSSRISAITQDYNALSKTNLSADSLNSLNEYVNEMNELKNSDEITSEDMDKANQEYYNIAGDIIRSKVSSCTGEDKNSIVVLDSTASGSGSVTPVSFGVRKDNNDEGLINATRLNSGRLSSDIESVAIGYIDSIYYSSADDKDLNKSFDKLYDNVNDLTEFATSELNFSKGKFTTFEISIDSNDIEIASSQDDVER